MSPSVTSRRIERLHERRNSYWRWGLPGLNAVIRAVVRKAERHYGTTVFGFHDGWKGILDQRYEELTLSACVGLSSWRNDSRNYPRSPLHVRGRHWHR